MPSKTLIYSAEVLHLARQGQVFGFEKRSLKAEMEAMQKRKRDIISEFADYRKGQLQDGSFSIFRSRAKFLDENTIKLENGSTLEADKILISTGSKISMPPVPGLDRVSFKTSDDVLDLSEVP